MKVLVTGSEGYIGTVLAQELAKAGHTVTGLDTWFYNETYLYVDPDWKKIPVIKKDTRTVEPQDLAGFDAVIHMADLSNDPIGAFSPENTYEINKNGSLRVAKAAKEAGVKRFIYSSSCSVYGIATEDFVTETSKTNPQTPYAECKVFMEQELAKLADSSFTPVILRNSTVFGASPNIRFDLVLNSLAGFAWTKKEIAMTSDGNPWRPIVHIKDVCEAFRCALIAPKETVHNEIFNVGSNINNYQVKDIAHIVSSVFKDCKVTLGSSIADTRSYRASFDKISTRLPGFKCSFDAEMGAVELYELFKRINLTPKQFESRAYTRLKQLQYLVKTNQIDKHFFWNK